ERAELPVHRNKTLNIWSFMGWPSKTRFPFTRESSAPARHRFDHRPAQFRCAVAAVLHQIGKQVAEAGHVRHVADDPAVTLRPDQAGLREHREMRRHRVLTRAQPLGDFPGRHALVPGLHKQPENIETRLLAESRQSSEREFFIHISALIDKWIRLLHDSTVTIGPQTHAEYLLHFFAI